MVFVVHHGRLLESETQCECVCNISNLQEPEMKLGNLVLWGKTSIPAVMSSSVTSISSSGALVSVGGASAGGGAGWAVSGAVPAANKQTNHKVNIQF